MHSVKISTTKQASTTTKEVAIMFKKFAEFVSEYYAEFSHREA